MLAEKFGQVRRTFVAALYGAVVILAGSSAFAANTNVEVGSPHLARGDKTTDYFTICRDKAKRHCFDVPVDVTWQDNADTKTTKLIKAINGSKDKEKDGVRAAQAKDKAGKPIPDTVTITGAADVDFTMWSKQFAEVVALGDVVPSNGGVVAGGVTGTVGFQGTLTGLASDGSASSFEADFAFAGVDDDVTLSYGDLTTPTTAGLLTQMFDDLVGAMPSQFQSSLTLDLTDGLISFDFPAGAQDPTVSNFTSDTGAAGTLGLEGIAVPEPSGLLFFVGGVAAVAVLRGRFCALRA